MIQKTGTSWHGVVRLMAGIFAVGLMSIPALAGPFTAGGRIDQFFSGGGDPGTGSGKESAVDMTWEHYFDSNNGLLALSKAASSAGLLKTLASVTMEFQGGASGSILARSNGGLVDVLLPDWGVVSARAGQSGVATMFMAFDVLVDGAITATSDTDFASSASVDYAAAVGDARASGTRSVTAGGSFVETGTWGNLIMTTTLPFASDVTLNLSASAMAGSGKTFMSFPKAYATADFSHTLRWGGVRRIVLVDGQGQQTDITGTYIPLIGRDTGFDYYYGVQESTSGVPEPSTMGLMAAGLAGLWWLRRR